MASPRPTDSGESKNLHEGDIHPITDEEFQAFRQLIHKEAGIFLSDVKRALLSSRLAKRLRHFSLQTYGQYYEYVRKQDPTGTELPADDQLHHHQQDRLLPRAVPFYLLKGYSISPGARAGQSGRPKAAAPVECRLLHRRGTLFPGHDGARTLRPPSGMGREDPGLGHRYRRTAEGRAGDLHGRPNPGSPGSLSPQVFPVRHGILQPAWSRCGPNLAG